VRQQVTANGHKQRGQVHINILYPHLSRYNMDLSPLFVHVVAELTIKQLLAIPLTAKVVAPVP